MRRIIVVAVASVALFGGVAISGAQPARSNVVARYQQALDRACQMGLEPGPDASRLYEQAHSLAPWLPDPALAADECFQSP